MYKEGDVLICTDANGCAGFTEGGKYIVKGCGEDAFIMDDEGYVYVYSIEELAYGHLPYFTLYIEELSPQNSIHLTDKEADQVLRNRLKLRLEGAKQRKSTISPSNDKSVQFSVTNKGVANIYRVENIEELDKIILALQDIKEYLK
jgi:hypothetical protein